MRKHLLPILALSLLALPAVAAEKVKGTTFFVVDQESWKTGEKSGYWIWHGEGVSHSIEGSLGTDAIECHGAGFWDDEGPWGEGICVHTAGEDTRTIHWKRDKGEDFGRWKSLSGTGKFSGMTGGGTYTPTPLPDDRHISEWEGEVTFAK